ncbi:hypothetical protein [Nonomuraea sp. PA05]|uniref:hypothetical protein n=1 Tax=Nonomuraea sp. PA05 TaxID=2604466 RepID=UPI001652257C|nr:hypothetical protein [Nonomuraea sp. PA05]
MVWYLSFLSQKLHESALQIDWVVHCSDVAHLNGVEEEFTVQLADGTTYLVHLEEIPAD